MSDEHLAQEMTVAAHSLSVAIVNMVNACTPSAELLTAIWKYKSHVDAERTDSGIIKLLQSLDYR